jgi:hypothetical protein
MRMMRWLMNLHKPRLRPLAMAVLTASLTAAIGIVPEKAQAAVYRLDQLGDPATTRLFPVGLEPRPDYGGQVVGDLLWLNRYTVEVGSEILDAVSLTFGATPRPGLSLSSGLADWQTKPYPVTVLLYSDPNNDGNPIDAQLLTQATGRVQNPDTNELTTIALPTTTLPVGQNFFVGALFRNLERNQRPATADRGPVDAPTASLGRSWFTIGNHGDGQPSNIDLTNLANNFAPNGGPSPVPLPTVYGNWVLRATGQPRPQNVPEPGVLFGWGAIGVGLLGRKFQRC